MEKALEEERARRIAAERSLRELEEHNDVASEAAQSAGGADAFSGMASVGRMQQDFFAGLQQIALQAFRRPQRFAEQYVTGWRLPFDVPVEEVAFFVVVPICSILTFEAVNRLRGRSG